MATTQGLFGGGAAGDEQKKKAEDFINRYQSGHPAEGYTNEEAVQQFQQAAKVATPEQMNAAFKQAVAGLPDNDRAQFNQMLQDRQAGKGMVDIERSGERKATTARSSSGKDDTVGLDDILGGLLGGASGGAASTQSGGGGLGDILGSILGGGTQQSHATQSSGGGLGDILGSVLGGGASAAPAPAPAPSTESGNGIGDMFGDILKSPIGKAILAGTAAYAMKEVLGGKK